MKRHSTAVWNGSGKEGSVHLTTQSTVLNKTQYSYNSRFAEGVGTNPEELLAAAHAGCFTMKMTFTLNAEGFVPDELETRCDISLENGEITLSELNMTAKIPGITEEKFQELAAKAHEGCLVGHLFKCPLKMTATLA